MFLAQEALLPHPLFRISALNLEDFRGMPHLIPPHGRQAVLEPTPSPRPHSPVRSFALSTFPSLHQLKSRRAKMLSPVFRPMVAR